MPTKIQEKQLTFIFQDGWVASRYDAWAFYRNQFVKLLDGIRAVDFIAIDPHGTAYLIEVKDYRHPDTVKHSQLAETIANKVLMTLAALLPCRLNGTDPNEQQVAKRTLKCKRLRVVAHIEYPDRGKQTDDYLADLRMKLEQVVRAVDAHPKVVTMQTMAKSGLGWSVRRSGA